MHSGQKSLVFGLEVKQGARRIRKWCVLTTLQHCSRGHDKIHQLSGPLDRPVAGGENRTHTPNTEVGVILPLTTVLGFSLYQGQSTPIVSGGEGEQVGVVLEAKNGRSKIEILRMDVKSVRCAL